MTYTEHLHPTVTIYCTDRDDYEVPKAIQRATHFRKNGDVDRRFANTEWHEWLKQIGESK